YLRGLASATGSDLTAGARTAPSPTTHEKIELAPNFLEKVSAAWWRPPFPDTQYTQTFGDVWVEYGPFVEVQPSPALSCGELLPSQAFNSLKSSWRDPRKEEALVVHTMGHQGFEVLQSPLRLLL